MCAMLILVFALAIGQNFGATTEAPTSPAGTSPVATSPDASFEFGLLPPGGQTGDCNEKKPCPDGNSACKDGQCICKEGFASTGNNTCIKSPELGDTCKVHDQEFYCTGYGVEINCPQNGTVCVCKAGYEKDSSKTCKQAARPVGASCKVDGDCTAAFTTCENEKCACSEGFKEIQKQCTPNEYRCLNKDKALEEKGKIRLCEASIDPNTGVFGNDTCPSGYFCNNWQNTFSASRGLSGHCCPKPTAQNVTFTCPVGVEHKTGKCPDTSQLPADAPLPSDIGPLCPLGRYDCYRERVCCPLACLSSSAHFNVNGRCYDTVILDQACDVDAQCLPNSACVKGKCQCKDGFTRAGDSWCLAPGQPNPLGDVRP